MAEDFEPCPFCGTVLIKNGPFGRRNVDCFIHVKDLGGVDYGRCPAAGFWVYSDDAERIALWNRRAPAVSAERPGAWVKRWRDQPNTPMDRIRVDLHDKVEAWMYECQVEPLFTRPAPVKAEPVGEAGTMPGTTGFTMAVFKASDVPIGTKLFAHPAPVKADTAGEGWKPTHRHVKTGGFYRLAGDAVLQTSAPCQDEAYLALYQGADGKYWVRPADEFKDGRFAPLSAVPATPEGPNAGLSAALSQGGEHGS